MSHSNFLAALGILSALTVACSSAPEREGENRPVATQDAEGLGSTQRAEGATEVKRKVVRTETVNRDVPTIRETRVKADINRMEAEDFVLMGMSREVAEKVVESRDDDGRFRSLDDLRRVPGVSAKWIRANRAKLGAG